MIIFGTEKLKLVTKIKLIDLFDYLTRKGYNFDSEKMVWHDGTHAVADVFHYIGLLCNEWGGIVVYVPLKAWNEFDTGISKMVIHTNEIGMKEFHGQTIKREGGFEGIISEIPTIVWKKP